MKTLNRTLMAVLLFSLLAPAPAAQARADVVGATAWSDLEGPVLAASDRGGQLLVGRRPVVGSELHGPVMAASLDQGASHWSSLERLSSQRRTVGLDADLAGAGHGLVAWTSGGNVYARSRNDRGGWGPELTLSRRTGTRWVSVDVNRAGDQLVTWLQSGRAFMAWREVGGTWERYRGAATRLHPIAALSERHGAQAWARMVSLEGTPGGANTWLRMRQEAVGGAPNSTTLALLIRPKIWDFAWAAAARRATVAVVTESDPFNFDDAVQRTLTTYDGPINGPINGPLLERWSQRSSQAPVISAVGTATRLTWKRLNLSGNLIDVITDVNTRLALGPSWGPTRNFVGGEGPSVTFDDLTQGIDAQGAGLLAFRTIEHPPSGPRDSVTVRRLRTRAALFFGPLALFGSDPISVGVGRTGPVTAAWATGNDRHPAVSVRGYRR